MRTHNYFALFALVLILVACSDNDYRFEEFDTPAAESQINVDNSKVSIVDVLHVADAYNPNKITSRANNLDISELKDENGKTAIYVVNFGKDNGFVLVSATKDYYPVLAYADKGKFETDILRESGLSLWEDVTKSVIADAGNQPEDSIMKMREIWNSYDISSTLQNSLKSRSSQYDEWYEYATRIKEDSLTRWAKEGHQILNIYDDFMGNPTESERIRHELSNGAMSPQYEEWWDELSVPIRKTIRRNVLIPYFVKTQWGQEMDYNAAFPYRNDGNQAKVGCGPLAVGQIMKYYEYPNKYLWKEMDNFLDVYVKSTFLLDVAYACKANFNAADGGTETNVNNYVPAFEYFGYTAVKETNPNLRLELDNHRPILMRGEDRKLNKAHAWIVCGYNYTNEEKNTYVYTFSSSQSFKALYSGNNSRYEDLVYYINWGFYGDYDGYYRLDALKITDGNKTYNFDTNFCYITNIKPNK